MSFFLNGEPVTITDPPPELLLIDYLREPGVALTGAKKACGQGGCGSCAVVLSSWDAVARRAVHRAVNACLRPVCALDGMAVTTIEGTGQARRPAARHAAPQENPDAGEFPAEEAGMNPVAHRLAVNHGTRCGYCAPGVVMTVCAVLAAKPEATKREIEDALDGNLCRCAGYRSILAGARSFAADWTGVDEQDRLDRVGEDGVAEVPPGPLPDFGLPTSARRAPDPVEIVGDGRVWLRPTTLADLGAALRAHRDRRVRLVNGNTSYGLYPAEVDAAEVLVDIQVVPELAGTRVGRDWIDVGASTTYSELIEVLGDLGSAEDTAVGALRLMARRTAGAVVRNAATVAGNTMLVFEHIERGEPVTSELMTAMVAVGAEITVWQPLLGEEPARLPLSDLLDRVVDDPVLLTGLVIRELHLPLLPPELRVFAQKVAVRDVDARAVVTATTVVKMDGPVVEDVAVVIGGIAPFPWRAVRTEDALRGVSLRVDAFAELGAVLRAEVIDELDRWRLRKLGVPWDGVTDDQRADLAVSLLYKAVVNALLGSAPETVPPAVRSAGTGTWGRWPLSGGTRSHEAEPWQAPVPQAHVTLLAFQQATGRVRYTGDRSPAAVVEAAFVPSGRALADFHFVFPGGEAPIGPAALADHLAARWPGFVDLITHEDIPPHGHNRQGLGSDQPLFAVDRVSYPGQAIALVLATTAREVDAIARHVAETCVAYHDVAWAPPYDEPVLTLDRALEIGSVFPDHPESANTAAHLWRVTRPGSDLGWVAEKYPLDKAISRTVETVDGVSCVVVGGTQTAGGQAHFPLEPQSCVVEPVDGDRLRVVASTQSPMEAHQSAALALGVEHHRVEVEVPPVGGGFGGKTEQTRFVVGPAVVAANAVGRPVRLVLPREQDTAMIGKRHGFYGQYQVAIDPLSGRVLGLDTRLWGDGGAFYDCSFTVANRVQLRADNAYLVPNFRSQVDVCRTNKAPSTAFDGSGDLPSKIVLESAVDDAAFAVDMDPTEVRETNLYRPGDVTPFGQDLAHCHLREVWAFLREKCDYGRQKLAVEAFNRSNRWRKRGIAMMPVRYGIGHDTAGPEQAVAHLAVYSGDGSVVIRQSGVELGQGLRTRVEQVVSYLLNVPFDLLRVEGPHTGFMPNPAGDAGGVAAVRRACEQLRWRLTEFGNRVLRDHGPEWCAEQGIDFWDHPEKGWATPLPGPGAPRLIWQNLVRLAYEHGEDLTVSFTTRGHGAETTTPAVEFKPVEGQRDIPGIAVDRSAPVGGPVERFRDFTYSAACSVVEVDILTGEAKVLRADIAYDVGCSLNPALDAGLAEGAFVQGIGYVLSEELVFEPDGPGAGGLTTTNTWGYKPPAVTSVPLRLNTHLYPRARAASASGEPPEVLSAKEVGEPASALATTVFLAVKAAVRASRVERGLDGLFRLDAPATAREVRRACAVDLTAVERTPVRPGGESFLDN